MNLLSEFWRVSVAAMCLLLGGGYALAIWLLPAPPSYFHSQYLSVALPEGWQCSERKRAFLCRFANAQGTEEDTPKSRQALIVFSTADTTPAYTFEALARHYSTPKPINTVEGLSASIVEQEAKPRTIDGRDWESAVHLHSELPHYRTRYLWTIRGDISVLISFTAHKLYHAEYTQDFEIALRSLEFHKPLEPSQ